MNKDFKIIAVDFDGTLCKNNWPEIGAPNTDVIEYVKRRKADGDKIILWTNREGDKLAAAIRWCVKHGIIFDTVNDNLPEIVGVFGMNTRKIFANEYIDDRNRLVNSFREKSNIEQWAEKEVQIACERERKASKAKDGEWDYGCACYESALKAFRSLIEDGHSGLRISFTKNILNRMIDGYPLTPIEDTDDEWRDITELRDRKSKTLVYQCTRMSSLFKHVYTDGTVKYSDINRFSCIDLDNPSISYNNGLVNQIMDEKFPITMPYSPKNNTFKVYREKFLVDPKNGNYDTFGILYAITPTGEKININRYFKEVKKDFDEINETEYLNRKESATNRIKEASNND